MHLDHQVDVGSDRLAHGRDHAHGGAHLGGAQADAGGRERIELHRPVAAGHDAHRQLGDPRRLVVGLVPAVGVGRHPIAEAPTEELVDRDAEVLADEVPRCEVERGEGRLAVLAGPAVLEALDRPGEALDVERVRPEDVATGQLADDGRERDRSC